MCHEMILHRGGRKVSRGDESLKISATTPQDRAGSSKLAARIQVRWCAQMLQLNPSSGPNIWTRRKLPTPLEVWVYFEYQ